MARTIPVALLLALCCSQVAFAGSGSGSHSESGSSSGSEDVGDFVLLDAIAPRLAQPEPSEPEPVVEAVPIRPCCKAMMVECLACLRKQTVAEFCAIPENAYRAADFSSVCAPAVPAEIDSRISVAAASSDDGIIDASESDSYDSVITASDDSASSSDDAQSFHSGLSAKMCCLAQTAECLACAEGLTVDQFCVTHKGTPGCPDDASVCCTAQTAECIACTLGVSVEQLCKTSGGGDGCPEPVPSVTTPPPTPRRRICCRAMTAQCLACSRDQTVEEFCRAPQNAKVAGCSEYLEPEPEAPVAVAASETTPKARIGSGLDSDDNPPDVYVYKSNAASSSDSGDSSSDEGSDDAVWNDIFNSDKVSTDKSTDASEEELFNSIADAEPSRSGADAEPSQSGGLGTGAIVGIAIGALVLVGGGAALAYKGSKSKKEEAKGKYAAGASGPDGAALKKTEETHV